MGDFVWALAAEEGPSLQINYEAPIPAFKAGSLWVVQTRLNAGTAYKYTWIVNGKPIGGANNLPAFGPDSYAKPGVPQGKLTGPVAVPSKIYPGVTANHVVLCAYTIGRHYAAGRTGVGRWPEFRRAAAWAVEGAGDA